ncbi:DUF4129 domain-containing protein [Actinacidiphila rubida]|uniref:Protein-glutamine gamma-glutamyltransferase-like C-terminal domain-containing protein n=1 Tax=Actinacidiphila rubida TaxID=310780 RepID=A0A1H8L037_9ACTN|nr:DUF4129 domain-containing protein [Actinacidiphila rubida]SEN98008.1 protein of unknown function [Actinacidiphila rubida]
MGRERTAETRRPGAIGAAQAALTVLVAGGAALAALLLHPGAGLFGKGRGPLGGNPVLVFGLALAALLGGIALRSRYLEQVRSNRELGGTEQRLADSVSRLLLAAALAVPLLVLVLHRFGTGHGDEQARHVPVRLYRISPRPLPAPPPKHTGQVDQATHAWLLRVMLDVGISLLAVVVVLAGIVLWRHLTRFSDPDAPADQGPPDDEQSRLARAVDSGHRALMDGDDPRAAVIACYAAMEASLAGSGVARRASDSPQDLLERAVAGGLPAAPAAAELTALFREARYSTHPMDGGHRDRAAAALAEIADGLRVRAAAAVAAP